ncbi:MAG: hypothetical protein LBH59_09850 [Planctomycetaceae bacterium]|jgi:di/tripeptidase|nr:hypothetical protein [Planctomycetaceae bacterium]
MKIVDYLVMPKEELFDMYGGQPPYYYRIGTVPILLVAHVDTVWQREPKKSEITDTGLIISSNRSEGIGADDRVGMYIIDKIFEEIDCSVLYTDEEEIGGNGARQFVDDYPDEQYNCIVEFDRRNNNDAVFYNCPNKNFIDIVCSEYWQFQRGSSSDISIIAPAFDCAAVNFSCGYYNAHKPKEHVVITDVDRIIIEGKKTIEKLIGLGYFPYYETE